MREKYILVTLSIICSLMSPVDGKKDYQIIYEAKITQSETDLEDWNLVNPTKISEAKEKKPENSENEIRYDDKDPSKNVNIIKYLKSLA